MFMTDWIDEYVASTAEVPSPEPFRLWSAITAISGVFERKVFTMGSAGPIYPNLFTVLVGPPAAGKTNAIRPIRDLWSRVKGLNLSPDNVTKAALIDALSRSLRTVINGAESAYTFSSMAVPCSEFGIFFTHHDLEFLSVLNHIYDSPPNYKEERRTSGIVEINKPYLVILAATQPDFLNSFLPEEAWGMGFASRLIMIYADATPAADLFATIEVKNNGLEKTLVEMFNIKGEFKWTQNAINEINAWNRAGCPPRPTHGKMLHYNGRRALHTIKLAMISSASRNPGENIVTVDDFERAKDWLLSAEVAMPDIFRAMGQKSDAQVISDLHFHIYRIWSSVALDKRVAITQQVMYEFLHTRVTSDRIPKLIDVAEKTGYIRKGLYPNEFIPNPLGSFGKS
jgi:hypothetical protein